MSRKTACLIYGPMAHYIDHLAPIAELLSIPLFVTEEKLFRLAKKYYPFVETIYWDYQEMTARLVENFDLIFSCVPRPLFDEIFFLSEQLQGKKVHTVWIPHGNSDKALFSDFTDGLKDEEVVLVYGNQMIDLFLKEKRLHRLKAYVILGNYRYQFYLKHKEFYRELVQKEIIDALPRSPRNILYAPTWQDQARSSTFFSAFGHLASSLPDGYNLLIKLHPNLLMQEEIQIDRLRYQFRDKKNLLFIDDFPPIYPLLDFVDIYLGDISSIGYDFLTMNKPLFFLHPSGAPPALPLYQCGLSFDEQQYDRIFSLMDQALLSDTERFGLKRKELYGYTFAKNKSEQMVKEEIEAALPEQDII